MTSGPGSSQPREHQPVLLAEVLQLLTVPTGGVAVDATLGRAGHATAIAEKLGPEGLIVAIDRDEQGLQAVRAQLQDGRFSASGARVRLLHGNFGELENLLELEQVLPVDAVLIDLGVSSPQLDQAERGFSFRFDGPLDMRMDQGGGPTAADLLAELPADELARIFWEYGEERHSRRIARKITEVRRKTPLRTTGELADLVRGCIPSGHRPGQRIDPATRVFQALRIAVNDELGALEAVLQQLPRCLKPGGRAAVISFHSLEDRPVKRAFQDTNVWKRITKKPVTASDREQYDNPRSRSAKLRVAERIEATEASSTQEPPPRRWH